MRYDIEGWGAAALYARVEKQKKIARAKKIRQAGLPANPPPPPSVEIFRTASGQLAYSKFRPNLSHLGMLWTKKAEGEYVSLPWVSILANDAR